MMGVLAGYHQPVRAGDFVAARKPHRHRAQHREQQEGDEHRKQREIGTRRAAVQVGPYQTDGAHAVPLTSRPLSRWTTRWAWLAAFGSCVTITMVLP